MRVVLSGDFCGLGLSSSCVDVSVPEGPEVILSNRCLWNRVKSFCLVTSLASGGTEKHTSIVDQPVLVLKNVST